MAFDTRDFKEVAEFVNYMNTRNCGHFKISKHKPTIDWDEEAVMQHLMSPREE